jgi:hypothetical protein
VTQEVATRRQGRREPTVFVVADERGVCQSIVLLLRSAACVAVLSPTRSRSSLPSG